MSRNFSGPLCFQILAIHITFQSENQLQCYFQFNTHLPAC